MKTGIPSPARSLGAPATPRRYRARGTRSVGSPARAIVSRRPSALAEDLKELRESQDSIVLTPLNNRSLLTDNTDIEEPRRKSWWKKLDDTSLQVADVLQGDNVDNANDIVEEFVDIEVPSLVHKDMSLDLPESSGTESIDSIVLPQCRLFTQKENLPRKTFGPAVCPRESLTKLQKNTETEVAANVGPKTLIAQETTQRSRPAFPANLLAGTPNQTAHDTSMNVAPKKLFGQQHVETKKKIFTKTLLETSQSKSHNNEQEIPGLKTLFHRDQPPKSKPMFPAELLNVSANKTAPNNTKLASEVQGQAHNLFGNRSGTKRKNMFADFIVAESEDEIQDIQPQVFGFSKRAESKEPQSGRGSSVSRGVRESSMSITTDIELEDWKMLPSSTMMVDQLEEMVAGTPKKMRLSKLSEQKESDGSKGSTTANKTKLSSKSISSKNNSKSIQNSSKSKIVDDNVVIDEVATTEKQSKSKTEVEYEKVHIINENKTNEQGFYVNVDEIVVVNNATNNSKITNLEKYQQALKVPPASQCKEPEITEQNKTGVESAKEVNTEMVDDDDNDDEPMALTYEEDVEEPVVDDGLEKQAKGYEETQEIENIEDILKNNTALNKSQQNVNFIAENLGNELDNFELIRAEDSGCKTEVVQPEQLSQTKEKDSPKGNVISSENYAEDNFEDIEINVDSVLQDEVSEITQDDSKVEISLDNKELQVEESIEQIQKEIERGEEEQNEIESGKVEQNQQIIAHTEEFDKENKDVSHNEMEQAQEKQVEQTKEGEKIIDAAQREAEAVKQTEEAIEHDDEIDNAEQNKVENTQKAIAQYDDDSDKEEAELSEAEVEPTEEKIEQREEIEEEEAKRNEANVEKTQNEIEQDDKENEEEAEESKPEIEQTQEEIEQDDEVEEDEEEAEQSEAEVEQSHEEIKEDDEVEEYEEEIEQSGAEVEQTQEEIEQGGESEQEDVDAEQSQEEMEQDDEGNDQIESDVEQSEEQFEEHIEQSQEEVDQEAEEDDIDQETEQDQEKDNNISQDSHTNMPSEEIPTPEQTDEIQGSPNVSHDTTGRNRKKIRNETQIKSPEAILKGTTLQNTSFKHQGRNTSVRKTKSMVRPLEHNPSLVASVRDSIGTNGSNSSAQGSGWDSHRTTRKTLRQTFGKDFTPRKSLRALVMEKSAQRQTMGNIDVDITKAPQANSTEINVNEEASLPSAVDNVEDLTDDTVSDHELSRKTRQSTLEMYLQKVKKDTLERKMKMESAVRESLKAPSRNVINQFNLPTKLGSGARKVTKPAQPRKTKTSGLQLGALPRELIEDMKYKPPKRFMPTNASWTTKRLYKFLESKLEPRYDYKARVRAEKLVETLYSFSKLIQRLEVAPREAIEELKVELARLNVAKTHFEFYDFFHEFMPREMRIKVVPDIQNKLPMPKYGLYSEIIREINSRG